MNYYNPMYGQYPNYQYGGMGGGQQMPPTQAGGTIPGTPGVPGVPAAPGQLPIEQSYIENILRLNKGKVATVYMTFENNQKWNAKVFKGIVEAAGRDHIVLSDPQTGRRYILLMVYVDYITFDEEIEYSYPLDQVSTYSPR
ncbi:spore coat protein GerQ [Bacillus taeanensis]|uniref:Spore coat protein GerQ n=1 Tax=Bacillus taeanensis TaxID=273032 RepID=A0A366XRJ7_9BACI|nr:spore coat protein GerQ [Bacillus taeanensis]RBW67399.1 spore coat protein GerQ [Bacillus taeanensis]